MPEPESLDVQNQTDSRQDTLGRVLWRRKSVLCASLILAAAAGIAYLLLATPLYTSHAKIRFPHLPPRHGDSLIETETFLNTEAEVIASTAVLLVALGNPDMEQVDLFQFDPNPIRALKSGLDVSIGRRSDLITISFTGPNRFDAQTVVASVVGAYQAFQSKERQDGLDAMDRERRKILDELAVRHAELVSFKKEHGQLAFDDNRENPILQRLASLSDALTEAHLAMVNAKTAYEDAAAAVAGDADLQRRLGGLTGTDTRLTVVNERMLRDELFNLQQRLEQARRHYGSNHPLVGSIQGRIDHLSVAFVGVARDRWQAAERRQAELERSFEALQEQAAGVQAVRAEYDRVRREVTRLERLADEVATRIQAMSVADGTGAGNITVLDSATLPDIPSSPNQQKVMAVALGGGLFVGLGLALLVDWRDQRLRNAADVQSALGVPVLGVVPMMAGGGAPTVRGLKTHLDPTSGIAEAYRAVRTNLSFGLPDSARTILVTSPQPADGKSTLVSNLAIAMAQAGRRTLILDANCRLPVQHKIFALPAGAGFTGIMAGRATMDQAILPSGVENLDLLPCGNAVPNPTEILNSQAFSDLLGDLAARYDYLLIDSPSLATAADARIASAWCDATLLVLHGERCERRLAQVMRDGLVAVGANLTGVIVNAVDPASRKHGFHAEFAPAAADVSGSQDIPAAQPYVETADAVNQPEEADRQPVKPVLAPDLSDESAAMAEADLEVQPNADSESDRLPYEAGSDELVWPLPALRLSESPADSETADEASESAAAAKDASADTVEPELPEPVGDESEAVGDESERDDQPQPQPQIAPNPTVKLPPSPVRETRNLVTGLDPEKLAETSAELRRKFEALR